MIDRKQWLEDRRTGVGGSDVAPILGLSQWSTPYSVWLDKQGQLPDIEENPAMKWGTILEGVIRQEYANQTGRVVVQPNEMLRHPVHHHMIANLDGAIVDERRIFEAKTARSANGWGDPGTDQIPMPYLFQVQHYMIVTGYEVADVAVLIAGSDFRLYEVHADRELQDMMIDAEAAFWQRVVAKEPPELTSIADAIAKYGRFSRKNDVVADDETITAIETLRSIKVARAALDEGEDAAKLTIYRALGDADTLIDREGKPLATWRAQDAPLRVDSSALKSKHPDIYREVVKQGDPTRRFLLK